jgi:hypothetical protein
MYRYTDVRRIFPFFGIISVTLLLLAVLLTPESSRATDVGSRPLLTPGSWGGRGAELRVGEGAAEIEFNCALGRIDRPFEITSSGEFSLKGLYFPEPGGPGRAGDPESQGLAAIYSGQLQDSELLLSVRITKAGRVIGPFALYKSQEPELEKCL